MGDLPPHIFSIGAQILNSFKNGDEMGGRTNCRNNNCCVVFTGESGAGKSQSAKQLLHFLAAIGTGLGGNMDTKIKAANLLIEAFGSAKLTRNFNGTRHGNYVELHYSANTQGQPTISGANFEIFLLEKSRVVEASANASGEGNFHIFYALLAGINSQQKLELDLTNDWPSAYRLLNSFRQNCRDQGGDDEPRRPPMVDLAQIVRAMRALLFREAEIEAIWRLLAAILHLGNLRYAVRLVDNQFEQLEINDRPNLQRICRLLKVEESSLLAGLTTNSEIVNGNGQIRAMNIEEAVDVRDKFIIELYARSMEHIMRRINEALEAPKIAREQKIGTVGLLDFQEIENNIKCGNKFEQLCANYAAECVQQFFIRRIYKLEQAEYAAQGLPDWEPGCLPYIDNLQILEMLAVQPLSVMSVIDDISIMPQASDEELLSKLHAAQCQNDRFYQKPKSELVKQFAIRHYNGAIVQYKINGMLEKNRDELPSQLMALINSSQFKFLRRLFDGGKSTGRQEGTITRLKQNKQCTKIRRTMDTLMSRLERCGEVYFVRCLKANDMQRPMEFDSEVVLRQIRQFDLLSNLEMCKTGFPVHMDYAQFVHKYRPLLAGIPPPQLCHCSQAAKLICRTIFGENCCAENVQFGKGKLFIKAEQQHILEMMRHRRLRACALLIQKCLQGWAKRQQYERLHWAAIVFQKNWRALAQRRKYQKFIRGITRLQALVRAHQLLMRYQWLRSTIMHFQANCRAALLRHQLRCLPTRVERHSAMMGRLEWQMTAEGEAPALELHKAELENIEMEKSGGAINVVKSHWIEEEKRRPIEEIGKYEWAKFAIAHFQQAECTPRHCRLIIRRSLLPQQKFMDELVAIAIWRRLLQLMGDLNVSSGKEDKILNGHGKNEQSIMDRLKGLYSKEYGQMDEQYLHAELIKYDVSEENVQNVRKSIRNACSILIGGEHGTALEKIQFINAVGIFRPNLRDEIYSQICKQINGNPSSTSSNRAWNLMNIFASSFMPSERLLPYLVNFVNKNVPNEAQKLELLIRRTRKNGTRRQPIIGVELAAAFTRHYSLAVDVNLADQRVISVPINSQSTAAELCAQLASQIGLKNAFGFGLFLTIGQSVRALGAGGEKLMDAFSQAEQQGITGADWLVYFRKDIFQPFESGDKPTDPMALNLAYRQIARGVHLGEYRCEKEEDLALLAAQQHFIGGGGQQSRDMDVCELEEALADYLPRGGSADKEEGGQQKWMQMVMNAHRKRLVKNDEMPLPTIEQIKCQVLEFAANEWPLLFSRFFEVYKYSGPSLPANQLTLGVNSNGIVMLDPKDEQQRVLLEIGFIELASIGYGRSKQQGAEAISLQLLNGDRYTFQSATARELSQLLSYMLEGLRKQSRFALVMQEEGQKKSRNDAINWAKGDLLILGSPFGHQFQWENASNEGESMMDVENTRTGLRGKVPLRQMHILACTEQPGLDQLASLLCTKFVENSSNAGGGTRGEENGGGGGHYEYPSFYPTGPFGIPIMPMIGNLPQPHTLEKFAADNFRQPQLGSRSTDSFGPYGGESELWRHSREPLTAPLLKRLASSSGKEELKEECLLSYSFILKYMADQPCHPQQYFLEHTDLIFAAPLKFEILRDETYCQLMKQLTDNGNPMSEERGWELMWLCLGLFPPTKGLRRELAHFIRSRLLPMAADCAIRLQKALSQCPDPSSTRRFPPHQVELEAIRHRQTQIYHKFYLPDGTQKSVEIESWTRAKDFAIRIASRIGLNSTQGFSLFIKLGEKVVCIPEHEFFFDFIHQLQDWARKNGRRKNGGLGMNSWNFNYQVHFMRKLWLDIEPGQDVRQDLIFNYHQELPKYLRGYHRIDKKEAVHFAALILRAQTRDEKQPPVQHIQHILHELVPKDLLKANTPNEWKKLISAEIARPGMPKNSADAKMEFLREIAKEPTFGSAFFEVKQSADPTLCSKLLVAINKEGMSLYDGDSKRHIQTHCFEQISNWQPANTYFHITLDKGNRLLFETTLGHKLDDLLTSYIQALIARQEKAATAKGPGKKRPLGINGGAGGGEGNQRRECA